MTEDLCIASRHGSWVSGPITQSADENSAGNNTKQKLGPLAVFFIELGR